jgi:PhnB protein
MEYLRSILQSPRNSTMIQNVNSVPQGFHTVTPYLLIKGASDAIAFYVRVFRAEEITRLTAPDGRIGHAEVRIGDSVVMIADEHPEMDFLGPESRGGTTVSLHIYVENPDEIFAEAIQAGATELRPLCDQFYGDRSGSFTDPWGHVWTVATRIEDVTPDELKRRFDEMYAD